MAQEFNPGDQVKHLSGGPVMTVDYCNGTAATCSWFDHKSGKFETATLRKIALKLHVEEHQPVVLQDDGYKWPTD